jgi:GTP-binding protein
VDLASLEIPETHQSRFRRKRQCAGAHGRNGDDRYIEVPLGTIAKDEETGEVLFEITEDGEEHMLVKGGRGGLGNVHFKSSTFQTPRFAQPGEDPVKGWFILELKVWLMLDLVGFPNAGRARLLSVVSAAKPEIANYPFTTWCQI